MKVLELAQVGVHLAAVLRSQWWPAERIRGWQEKRLTEILRYAVRHVPFYRDLGIRADTIRSPEDLLRFPLLDKSCIQAAGTALLAEGQRPDQLHLSVTSGSTGQPTRTYFDASAWALCKYALKMRRIFAVTNPAFKRCIIVTEQGPDKLAGYARERALGLGPLYCERLLSIFDELPRQLAQIDAFGPDLLYAFPSYLADLVHYCESQGRPVPQVSILFTSSEVLTTSLRQRIEAAFGGQLFDVYGSTEFKEIAWQCRHGSYHLNFESMWVESLPSAPDAGQRRLVLTGLANRAMPLIRFDIGDLGELRYHPCPCGRQSPILTGIHGREVEVMVLPSGRRLSPYVLTTTIELLPGLAKYRVVHETPQSVRVECVSQEPLPEQSVRHCIDELQRIVREPVSFRFVRLNEIPRTAGGKHKVFVKEA